MERSLHWSKPVAVSGVRIPFAPPLDWLQKAWAGAKRRGLDTLMPAEIDAHRHKPDPVISVGVK
jgi:hypothetical protein